MKNGLILIALALVPSTVYATDISVYLSHRQTSTTSILTLYGVISTPINALEGTIVLPENIATQFQWDDSESPIRMWISSPSIVNGAVSFAGIIPGGLATSLGAPIPLLRIYASSSSSVDLSNVHIRSFLAYRHQQAPELASVVIRDGVLTEDSEGAPLFSVAQGSESLIVEFVVSRFAEIASGAPVAIFSPLSRGVITDRTMIRERFLGVYGYWKPARSPYVLQDRLGLSAVDLQIFTSSESLIVTEIPIRLYVLWGILGVVLIYTIFRKVF